MSEILKILREFMVEQKVDYLLVNSTNKYLVEYNSLSENSRYHLTGFSGSTGDALVSMKDVFLFVDGRYHIQADLEVDKNIVTVVKLQTGQSFLGEMVKKIPKDATLGVFSKKNSQKNVEFIQKYLKIKLLDYDPLDINQTGISTPPMSIPDELTGMPSQEKIKQIKLLKDEAIVLTNLEEISYLFNLRDYTLPFSSKIQGKALITNDKAVLFTDAMSEQYEAFLKSNDKKRVFVDKSSINAYEFSLLGSKAHEMTNNPIKSMKSVKTSAEINHYKDAFAKTDKSLFAVRDYIENTDNISEFDIALKLEEEFYKNGAKSLSFNSIVAKDKNSASAHYSKASQDEVLTDGSLILIDCGAYFDGGLATDITRVFVKGQPSELQKKVYTTVLRAFLHAFNTKLTPNLTGFDIDFSTRKFLAENKCGNFVFNHGLGHGIGISVHEAPPNLGTSDIAKTELTENMCFTIEPGLYDADNFGVRLENSCFIQNGKIESFVKMPYEYKLIDFSLLTEQEALWLKDFEVV